MHAQLAGAVEQQDKRAAPDASAFAQLGTRQRTEQAIFLIDPGHLFQIGRLAMGTFFGGNAHQPWLSRLRRSMIAALAREM